MTRLTVRRGRTGTSGDEEERAQRVDDAKPSVAADEPRLVRGPFEPLRPGDREEAGSANYQPSDPADFDGPAFDGPAFDGASLDEPDADRPESEISKYELIDDEMPEMFDFGASADPEEGALGQIRDLYQTAETVSQASLDRHFEQVLERQRQLISDYFKESSGLGPADSVTLGEPVAPAVSFGFDSAESLASLRGELRDAQ